MIILCPMYDSIKGMVFKHIPTSIHIQVKPNETRFFSNAAQHPYPNTIKLHTAQYSSEFPNQIYIYIYAPCFVPWCLPTIVFQSATEIDEKNSTIFLLVRPSVCWFNHFFGGSEVWKKNDFLVSKASCSIHFCSHFCQLNPNSPFLFVDSIHSPFLWLNSLWLKFPFLFLEFHKNSWWKSPFCYLESCEKET